MLSFDFRQGYSRQICVAKTLSAFPERMLLGILDGDARNIHARILLSADF